MRACVDLLVAPGRPRPFSGPRLGGAWKCVLHLTHGRSQPQLQKWTPRTFVLLLGAPVPCLGHLSRFQDLCPVSSPSQGGRRTRSAHPALPAPASSPRRPVGRPGRSGCVSLFTSFLRLRWRDKVLGGEQGPGRVPALSRKANTKEMERGREAEQEPAGSVRSYLLQV